VLGLTSGVSQVIARSYTACALLTTGSVKCWGYNNDGQIGDGTTTDRYTPTQVSGLTSGVERISVGGFFACSLLSTGTVKCWGDNSFGKLGDGSTTDRYAPVDVLGL
jgi:alpha-tubulin suppressor-like RCC1 family protein